MLRQIANLRLFGRLRTKAPTPRIRQPKLLRGRPDLQISSVLPLVLAHYGRADENFFFVQIGAFDGQVNDPLYELVRGHRWRGVLVEPQPGAFERLKRNYHGQVGLQFFNVAIGAQDGEITLYTRAGGDVEVASTQRQLLVKPGHRRGSVVSRRVPCWTVGTLLERAGGRTDVDLLQIDAEGCDYQIIRALDFAKVKPTVIRFEHAILSSRDRNACLALLAEQGYRFLLEDVDTTAILSRASSDAAAA